MKIDILTLFPNMFQGPFDESIIKRAKDKSLVEIRIHNLRNWTKDKHKTVDDRPYGGGPGMILMIEPIYAALQDLNPPTGGPDTKVILLTPQGQLFHQQLAQKLTKTSHLILIAGHYEGYDERITKLVDEQISIGDYILTGGELPTMVLVDCLIRLLPNVLKKPEAIQEESFSKNHLLEYPQYTRPENFKGLKVPKILLSGNHQQIAKWRKRKSLKKTKTHRPDLLKTS